VAGVGVPAPGVEVPVVEPGDGVCVVPPVVEAVVVVVVPPAVTVIVPFISVGCTVQTNV
jgi:hypothetical protein